VLHAQSTYCAHMSEAAVNTQVPMLSCPGLSQGDCTPMPGQLTWYAFAQLPVLLHLLLGPSVGLAPDDDMSHWLRWTRSRIARFGNSAALGISCPVTGDRGGPPPSVANQPSIALRSYVCPSDAMTGSRMRT